MDLERYARHLTLPEVGIDGQRRLGESRVLVVGAGGLGSPVLLYLAAAGVGRITIVDDDRVALSNLQRQVVHDTAAVGQEKVASAAARLRALNPDVAVTTQSLRVGPAAAASLVADADAVVDGTDNFPTRYALSDACAAARVPYVYGSVQGFGGQAAVLCTGDAPCYRCLHPDAPPPGTVPSCGEVGVLGVLPGLIGTIQATEVLKLLLGIGDPLLGRLLLVDGLRMRFHEITLERDPQCPACGTRRTTEMRRMASFTDRQTMDENSDITPAELKSQLDAGRRPVLIDVREPAEWAIAHLDGATHIPLAQLQAAAGTLDPQAETVVYCHHGMRSAAASDWLRRSGFQRVRNLAGGIDRWSTEVDPTTARY